MLRNFVVIILVVSAVFNAGGYDGARKFIAHRGVNLRSTIAGENSLEAIRLAKRAGFDSVETDVRLTSDDSLVVMHDATLNRTCLNADGSCIAEPVNIADLTYSHLSDYKLKADSVGMQTRIPLLSEYLEECRNSGIFVFIEPKLVDTSGRYYARIIALADSILGKNNYVVTSNNKANIIIRDTLGLKDIPLMGILYQSTFTEIERLGNIIMAISASKIKEPKYTEFVNEATAKGMVTESHADKFEYFNRINHNKINYVSTDFLAPDFNSQMHVAAELDSPVAINGPAKLAKGQKLVFKLPADIVFGASYLNMDFGGKLKIKQGNQTFITKDCGNIFYQILLYRTLPTLEIEALEPSVIKKLDFKAVDF